MSWCVYKYMAIFIIMIFWNMIGTSACQQSQSILNNNISKFSIYTWSTSEHYCLKDSYLLSCLDDTLYWRQRSNQLRLKRMFLTPQKGIMNGWVSSSVSIPNGGIFLHPKLSSMYLEIGKKFWFCHVSDLFLTHNDFSFL